MHASELSRANALSRYASHYLRLVMTPSRRREYFDAWAITNASYTARTFTSHTKSPVEKSSPKTLDPDKIKGPGGLTMTQIGRLVKESRTRDLEYQANTKAKQSSTSNIAENKK
ncbi:hypothetical protein BCR41DRAFT_346928 [Lobosporangium transversale]|uniref:Uncharacterized protein n=1 Tax=Lobosporangium transversale TaxID=64571 RepID=A0A1Y2H1C8_9FUNG|nr:hypothetical protein BCR41DRAFT_346928 [Lobosporangium transversale]ORZ27523.1 hypothetical protein BCR41DRAFT_346928 [Lobosporangium transversale]|eukprot:XP_021885250.1 hypothetical protein BCR41DRAFT_346928 [Lobosporangium transversale]